MRSRSLTSVAVGSACAAAIVLSGAALADDDIRAADADGPYRTLCVRLCDGYYFPIRTYAQTKDFAGDAQRCKAACRSPAALYVHRTFGEAPSTMTDLAGRKYTELPTAFLFQRENKPGCVCKPPAWSEAELARHRAYAEGGLAAQSREIAAAAKGESKAEAETETETATASSSAIDGATDQHHAAAASTAASIETPYLSQRARERAMRRRAALEAPSRRAFRSFRLIHRYNFAPVQRAFAD